MSLRRYKITLFFLIILLSVITAEPVFTSDNWFHYEQGIRMIDAKNWDQAQREFTYYLTHPEMHRHMFGVAYFGRGLMFQAMGKYDQAIKEFKLAIQNDLHPIVSVADKSYMNIGNIYFKNKSYKDSIMAYSKAVEVSPKNGLAHYYLGLSYLRVSEYDKAEKEAEEAKKLGVPFTALTDELNTIKNSSSQRSESKQNNKTDQTTKIKGN